MDATRGSYPLFPKVCCWALVVGWIFPFLDAQDQLKGAQENQHLLWSKDEVQQWSLAAQKQAGYVLDNPFLGHCDEKNPVDVVGVDAEITG